MGSMFQSVKEQILAHMRDGRETWLQRHVRKCQNQDLHAVRGTILDVPLPDLEVLVCIRRGLGEAD